MNFFRTQSQFTMSLNYRYIIYNDDTSLSLPEFNKLLGRLGQRTRYVTPKKINLSKFRKNNSFRLVFTFHPEPLLKSDNLQYDTLVSWFTGTNDLSTKRLIFQALFFKLFLIDLGYPKLFISILVNL